MSEPKYPSAWLPQALMNSVLTKVLDTVLGWWDRLVLDLVHGIWRVLEMDLMLFSWSCPSSCHPVSEPTLVCIVWL